MIISVGSPHSITSLRKTTKASSRFSRRWPLMFQSVYQSRGISRGSSFDDSGTVDGKRKNLFCFSSLGRFLLQNQFCLGMVTRQPLSMLGRPAT